MALAQQCPNYQINIQMCPCLEESCPRHGVCCECAAYHRTSTQWPETACMGGVGRPEETFALEGLVSSCDNQSRNAEACLCAAQDCPRRGRCCECVRHHWMPEGSKVACFR